MHTTVRLPFRERCQERCDGKAFSRLLLCKLNSLPVSVCVYERFFFLVLFVSHSSPVKIAENPPASKATVRASPWTGFDEATPGRGKEK